MTTTTTTTYPVSKCCCNIHSGNSPGGRTSLLHLAFP